MKDLGINRVSLGIQSFQEQELKFLGRRHDATCNHKAITQALEAGFKNISLDLIYGLPGSDRFTWQDTLENAFSYPVEHISAYHLTIEPNTVFWNKVHQGEITEVSEELSLEQFQQLISHAVNHGFEHYELSNFALPGWYSQHNTSYWQQIPYLGLGPSAHSYNGDSRQWNVSDINRYMNAISEGTIPAEKEILTHNDRFNEYLITGLRTQWGIDLQNVETQFGSAWRNYLWKAIQPFIMDHSVIHENTKLKLSNRGKMISDSIFRELILPGEQ
jgi:oxygen-independent coproporphyrinogen-3 oxidase